MRKLLLTSIIIIVAPGTRVQLWFGLLVSTAATIGTIKRAPYRNSLCQELQAASMLQSASRVRS